MNACPLVIRRDWLAASSSSCASVEVPTLSPETQSCRFHKSPFNLIRSPQCLWMTLMTTAPHPHRHRCSQLRLSLSSVLRGRRVSPVAAADSLCGSHVCFWSFLHTADVTDDALKITRSP